MTITLAQAVLFLRREIAAGGPRRSRALAIARALQAWVTSRTLRAPAPTPIRPPPRGTSGNDLASGVTTIAPVLDAVVPGLGQGAAKVFGAIAPILDTSLQSVQCAPGNPNWPACATPGGSAAALVQAGLSPAAAQGIVAQAAAGAPVVPGLSSGGGRPNLRVQ